MPQGLFNCRRHIEIATNDRAKTDSCSVCATYSATFAWVVVTASGVCPRSVSQAASLACVEAESGDVGTFPARQLSGSVKRQMERASALGHDPANRDDARSRLPQPRPTYASLKSLAQSSRAFIICEMWRNRSGDIS